MPESPKKRPASGNMAEKGPRTASLGQKGLAVGREVARKGRTLSEAGRGNRNALRHGLVCGRLPADAKHIEIKVNVFRRHLEDQVLAIKGEINLTDASIIDTACKWVRHERLAHRWLEKKYNELKPDQLMHFSREIAKASVERDKAIQALGLDKPLEKPWEGLTLDPEEEPTDPD